MTQSIPGFQRGYERYERAERELHEAYQQLTLGERFRANRGTLIGFIIAIGVGIIVRLLGIPSISVTFGIITSAFAQSSPLHVSELPSQLIYIIYIALLLLMLGCFYAAIVMKITTMIVRDTAKTLLGFFVGILMK